jgi:hypothetical protein
VAAVRVEGLVHKVLQEEDATNPAKSPNSAKNSGALTSPERCSWRADDRADAVYVWLDDDETVTVEASPGTGGYQLVLRRPG